MPRRPKRSRTNDPPDPGLLTIGALARATSIPVPTLRTWERRYRSPEPTRKPSGHRLYPVSLVGRLRRVALLLDRGHRPSEILQLTSAELDSLLALSGAGAERIESPASIPRSADPQGVELGEMLQAVRDLDRDALIGALRRIWIRLGPLWFLQHCAAALMEEVGASWHAGKLEIRHEHFATACLSDFLREVREPFDRETRGPLVVAAMLPGDAHEGGLLMVSVILAMRSCRVLYLGLDTPVEEIATAARDRAARAVALSISVTVPHSQARKAVAALRAALPRRIALWVGGAGAPAPPKGVQRFDSLEKLDAMLVPWAESVSGR
jgi:methanogenic corrinoid protein MtbC1